MSANAGRRAHRAVFEMQPPTPHIDRSGGRDPLSPSEWSPRFGGDAGQVLRHHCAFVHEHSDRVREQLHCETHAYGPSAAQTLDLFSASADDDTPKSAPILAFVHGGYWRAGSRRDSAFVAQRFVADGGCRVCVIGYDLCPLVSVEQIGEQLVRAMCWLGDYARVAGSR